MYRSLTCRPIDFASACDRNPTRALESRSSSALSCFAMLTWAASSEAVRVQTQTCFFVEKKRLEKNRDQKIDEQKKKKTF